MFSIVLLPYVLPGKTLNKYRHIGGKQTHDNVNVENHAEYCAGFANANAIEAKRKNNMKMLISILFTIYFQCSFVISVSNR